jgi:actin-like ATPase involved in cell morphogenesis
MPWDLGIDLGTTFTAAAVVRQDTARMATLGDHGTAVPSVLFLKADGTMLVGEAAIRRGIEEPERVARETKRRVGDPVPVMLGGTPFAAELLQARLLRWAVDRLSAELGESPRSIAVTHPASWGPYKLDLLRSAFRQVGVDAPVLVPEPVAAATAYAADRPLPPGALVAVYDLGGGTFDCCVLRREPDGGFTILGAPEGVERLGGIDFDQSVFTHLRRAVPEIEELDPADPPSLALLANLRRECVSAKEALSADTDATMSVVLPTRHTSVRLTRAEFEDMIRPALAETVTALQRTIAGAGIAPDDLHAILLVGGSSRIPLVAQMIADQIGQPVAVDAHPKDAIALGAAMSVSAAPAAPPVPAEPTTAPIAPPAARPSDAPEPAVEVPPTEVPDPGRPRRKPRRAILAGAAALVVVAAVATLVVVLGGGDGDELEGDLSDDLVAGEVITETVSVPDHSVLVVRATADTDSVASVLADEDVATSCEESFTQMADAGTGIGGTLDPPFPTAEAFDGGIASNFDASLEDELPSMVIQSTDAAGEGDEELLIVPFLDGAEVEVVVHDLNAGETSMEASWEIIEIEDPDGDPVTFATNIDESEEFREQVPDAPF